MEKGGRSFDIRCMIMFIWVSYVIFAFAFLQNSVVFADLYFTTTKRDTRLQSSLLYSRRGINVHGCVMECSSHKHCSSLNFHAVDSICELNKDVSLVMKNQLLTKTEGWNYYEKSEKEVIVVAFILICIPVDT